MKLGIALTIKAKIMQSKNTTSRLALIPAWIEIIRSIMHRITPNDTPMNTRGIRFENMLISLSF
jgi:hypothetical protein